MAVQESDSRLDVVLDFHNRAPIHLQQIADSMYEWEGAVAENLELTSAEVEGIKVKHPRNLKSQT